MAENLDGRAEREDVLLHCISWDREITFVEATEQGFTDVGQGELRAGVQLRGQLVVDFIHHSSGYATKEVLSRVQAEDLLALALIEKGKYLPQEGGQESIGVHGCHLVFVDRPDVASPACRRGGQRFFFWFSHFLPGFEAFCFGYVFLRVVDLESVLAGAFPFINED